MPPDVRPAVPHPPWAAPADRDAVEMVAQCVGLFETGIGIDFKARCERFYGQYRGFKKWQDAWVQAGPRDRDALLYDGKRSWGAQLHIPLSFRTIETMVPAAIAQRPRLLYLPRPGRAESAENVANVRMLIDHQQDQIDIDLPFQAVMRSGRIYGLGVGKCYWRTELAKRRGVKRRRLLPSYIPGDTQVVKEFDDPDFEDVDVFDFMWDPFGSDMRTCEWVVHRTWLSLGRCLQRIESGAWGTDSVKALVERENVEEELRRMSGGSPQKYEDVWRERMLASGFGTLNFTQRGEQIHEVLEWHDGERVLTVLDRALLVQDAENQCVGHKPFGVYRPTPLQKQMVGIGDLEPLEHLQRELDTLRSQRRDSATLALAAGYVYDTAAIDAEQIVFGPFAAMGLDNVSDVRAAIQPIQRQEVPGSGYQEEQVIRQDFDVVPGINDALSPQQGPNASTATEAQLVQAALGRRIELGSRRFEIEVVRTVARCWLYLDQRMILENRQLLLPPDGMTFEQAAEAGEWRKVQFGPGELMGEFLIVPEGGSMAARNIPQDRQDAQIFLSPAFQQNPYVEPGRALQRALELMGEKDPKGWVRRQQPPVPPAALEILARAGVDQRLIQRAVALAQRQDPMLPTDDGPDVGQVNQAMGVAQ